MARPRIGSPEQRRSMPLQRCRDPNGDATAVGNSSWRNTRWNRRSDIEGSRFIGDQVTTSRRCTTSATDETLKVRPHAALQRAARAPELPPPGPESGRPAAAVAVDASESAALDAFVAFTERGGRPVPGDRAPAGTGVGRVLAVSAVRDTTIRAVACTTNALESISTRIQRAVNARDDFPTEGGSHEFPCLPDGSEAFGGRRPVLESLEQRLGVTLNSG